MSKRFGPETFFSTDWTLQLLDSKCPDCTEEGLRTETSIHDDDAVYMLKTDRADS